MRKKCRIKKVKLYELFFNFLKSELNRNDMALVYSPQNNADALGWNKFNKKVMLSSICRIDEKDNLILSPSSFYEDNDPRLLYRVHFNKKWKTHNGKYVYDSPNKTSYDDGAKITFMSDVLRKLLYLQSNLKISFFISNNNQLKISNK